MEPPKLACMVLSDEVAGVALPGNDSVTAREKLAAGISVVEYE